VRAIADELALGLNKVLPFLGGLHALVESYGYSAVIARCDRWYGWARTGQDIGGSREKRYDGGTKPSGSGVSRKWRRGGFVIRMLGQLFHDLVVDKSPVGTTDNSKNAKRLHEPGGVRNAADYPDEGDILVRDSVPIVPVVRPVRTNRSPSGENGSARQPG
jgi:hypothetical protein